MKSYSAVQENAPPGSAWLAVTIQAPLSVSEPERWTNDKSCHTFLDKLGPFERRNLFEMLTRQFTMYIHVLMLGKFSLPCKYSKLIQKYLDKEAVFDLE